MSTYNGWANYETWNVKLWLDNDEGSYRYWQEAADEAIKRKVDLGLGEEERDYDDAVSALCHQLKDEITDQAPEVGGCYGDLLSAALSEVNWYEIAESLVGEAKERVEA